MSGLPLPNDNHAGQIASMALEMLAEVKNHEVSHRPTEKVLLRIGIHTGMIQNCSTNNQLTLLSCFILSQRRNKKNCLSIALDDRYGKWGWYYYLKMPSQHVIPE